MHTVRITDYYLDEKRHFKSPSTVNERAWHTEDKERFALKYVQRSYITEHVYIYSGILWNEKPVKSAI